MPKFRITGPDGQSYEISAPDGASEQDVLAYAQRNYKMAAAPAKPQAVPETPGMLESLGMGAGKGFGSSMLTLQKYAGKALPFATPALLGQYLASKIQGGQEKSLPEQAGQWLQDDAEAGQQKLKAQVAPYEKAHPIATGTGDVAGGLIATLPVGGAVGTTIQSLADIPQLARVAPQLAKLATAARTSGVRTGAPLAADATLAARAGDLAIRSAGAATTGGLSAAIATPDHIERGALLSAALPPSLVAAAKMAKWGGGIAKAAIQPFTDAGQDSIAARIIQKFGEGGPMAVDAAELVPGSLPTLAESTGNAGIATLQRGVRDLRPNAFVERETANAAARHALFDGAAGDANALGAATAARDNAADALYGRAFAADAMRQDLARSSQQARAPFAAVGLSGAMDDLATPGLHALAERPMFKQAVDAAKQLAANHGVQLDDPLQSLQGLHYVKLALDDALNPAAKSAMGRNASAAVMDMRDKLADELTQVSPLYGNARQTFAEMSQPINAMDAMQGLKLTNAPGNMTLSKVKNAIDGLEKLRSAPGVNPAKSITPEQLDALKNIHADLLRQDLLGAGKSAGSATFQNISTGNLLDSLMPGALGAVVKSKIATPVGQLGKLAYSSSDEAIRSKLTDMMLTPELLRQVLARQQSLGGPTTLEKLLQSPGVQQSLTRTTPITADRP
jgi:hypothetical protein